MDIVAIDREHFYKEIEKHGFQTNLINSAGDCYGIRDMDNDEIIHTVKQLFEDCIIKNNDV